MRRDARSCQRPQPAPTPRWRRCRRLSPRSGSLAPCSGFFGDACLSTPHGRERRRRTGNLSRGRRLSAHPWRLCATGTPSSTRQVSSFKWLWALVALPLTDATLHTFDRRRATLVRHHDRPGGWLSLSIASGPVRIGLGRDLQAISAYSFSGLIRRLLVAVIFWTGTAWRLGRPVFLDARRYRDRDVVRLRLPAPAHTPRFWRYLIPAVPMVASSVLFAVELPKRSHATRG